MEPYDRRLTKQEAADAAALDVRLVQVYAEQGIIAPAHGYGAGDLAELRRVRRLMDDLGLDQAAIEIVLRMRQRMLQLQAEIGRLERQLHIAGRSPRSTSWSDADWTDL